MRGKSWQRHELFAKSPKTPSKPEGTGPGSAASNLACFPIFLSALQPYPGNVGRNRVCLIYSLLSPLVFRSPCLAQLCYNPVRLSPRLFSSICPRTKSLQLIRSWPNLLRSPLTVCDNPNSNRCDSRRLTTNRLQGPCKMVRPSR
jgi:hypothetical protein